MKKLQEKLQENINKLNTKLFDKTKRENYEDYIGIAESLIDLANDQGIVLDIPKEIQKHLEIDEENNSDLDDKIFMDSFNKQKSFNKKFSSMVNDVYLEYDENKRLPRLKTKVLQKEVIDLSRKFLKQYDQNIYDYFENMLITDKMFFTRHILDYLDGYTTNAIEDVDSFVIIKKHSNIKDLIVTIHELIHSYISIQLKDMNLKERIKYDYNNIYEVYPSFIELVISNYLKEINFNQDDLNTINKSYNNGMLESLASLYDNFEYEDYITLNDSTKSEYMENQAYSYGRVFAYYFYEQYLKNKDEAKENILKFMVDAKNKDLMNMLNNYGLNKKDLTSPKKLNKCIKLI